MAALQEPAVQLAQRLASNEKNVRSKAIKKLRKYISVRSQNTSGGFTGDELLKLWKGLFYCLWMQDKPLQQEELSSHISTLIHNFHNTDQQLMYMESFLQTFKREWTGIDRLRMDKFYQVVRFMFRQTFEVLKRKRWEDSVVARFLQLLTSQLLQTDSETPPGLLLHVLDLYMSELAVVGSAELTADQNLMFIEPFCKTAAKTKNRMLFGAICSSFFSTMINQAPFAIEDLMKEVNASDSDSGQASEEDDDVPDINTRSQLGCRKGSVKQIDGHKPKKDEEDDDDELLHLQDSDTELQREDIGAVLQFDYGAVANKLFALASRSSTPGHNRQKLYKIIKVLRDLSEGVFPQDDCSEEVSTDEDDDMFGSRKRIKRSAHREDDEGESSAGMKSKAGPGKKMETLCKQSENSDSVTAPVSNRKKRKQKKKKKAENKESPERAESTSKETENILECSKGLTTETQSSSSSSQVSEGPSEPLCLLEAKGQLSFTVPQPCIYSGNNQAKKKKGNTCVSEAGVTEKLQELQTSTTAETSSEASVLVKKKNKRRKISAVAGEEAQSPQMDAETDPQSQKKKKGLKLAAGQLNRSLESSTVTDPPPAEAHRATPEGKTAKKKKRKIPVEFEFELDEVEVTTPVSDITGTTKTTSDVGRPFTPLILKKFQKEKKTKEGPGCDFITFQSRTVPKPLFCKTSRSPNTPLTSKKKRKTPKSEPKKVTFGLRNNKTAEFKKTDRSLLLSPEGPSRVPFDPEQKPRFGVLKSPATPVSTALRKTPNSRKKTPRSTAKGRPLAADFF